MELDFVFSAKPADSPIHPTPHHSRCICIELILFSHFPIFSLQAIQASERCFILGFSLFCNVRYPLSFFAIASYTIPLVSTPLYLYTHIPHRSFLERIYECWIVIYGIYGLGKAFCSFIDLYDRFVIIIMGGWEGWGMGSWRWGRDKRWRGLLDLTI
jgi:hypothetical protein